MSLEAGCPGCGHAHIDTAGLAPDAGGQVHELGECRGCGARVQRTSPLHPWTPATDASLEPEA